MARRQYQSQFDFSGLPDQNEDEEELPQITYGPGYPEPQQQNQFDFSGLPDQLDTPITDMDIPRPQSFPITPQQAEIRTPEPLAPDTTPSVFSPVGIWERFRSPLDTPGARNAPIINEALFGQSQHPHANFGRGVVNLGASVVDSSLAPINAIPMALGGAEWSAGKFGLGALAKAFQVGGRIASVPTMISGSQQMKEAETFPEFGLGALETVGGFFGARRPKGAKLPELGSVTEVIEDIPTPGMAHEIGRARDAVSNVTANAEYAAMQSRLTDLQTRMRAGALSVDEIEEAKLLNKTLRADPRFGQPVTPPTFEDINTRMMELYEKGNNGTLNADELAEAQKLNKVWREHPEFGKTPVQKTTGFQQGGIGDPNLNQGIGDPMLAGSVPYGPETTGVLGGTPPTTLPKDLAGAKPRANLGGKIFIPQFESDIDKALYIVAQSTPSKRDADYMNFLMQATGLDEDGIRALAAQQKQTIKQQMQGSLVSGDIPIKRMWTPETQAPNVAPTSEALASQFPAGPTAAKAVATTPEQLPDYSVSSELKAREVLASRGIQVSPDMPNSRIIDQARQLLKATNPVEEVAKATPEIVKKGAPEKVLIEDIGNGEFVHKEYPDYVLDASGNIKRTISGKPINAPEEIKKSLMLEILNTPRSINASMDLSFPFRQGVTLMHKGGWWRAWGDMVKSFGSQKAFDGTMASIMEKPNYRPNIGFKNAKGKPTSFADWAGLAITDQTTVHELEHMRSFAEKIPGIKQIVHNSNRGYIAFANKLRSDVFDSLVDDFTKAGMDPRNNKELAQQIAGFVNSASGRGDMKSLERYMEGLNIAFFSPRLQLSRMQMLGKSIPGAVDPAALKNVGQSLYGKFDPKVYEMMRPNIRAEYLKSMLTLGSAWATVAGVAGAMGAEVSLDPTNSDFMKIKLGNTRLDPGGGFQQFIVLAARIAAQRSTSSTSGETKKFNDAEGPYDPTMLNTLGRFGYNKLAPIPRAAVDLFGRTKKDPFDIADTALRMGSPILAQDVIEILTNEGLSPELLSVPPTAFGIGAQTYGEGKDFNRRMLGPETPFFPSPGADWRFPQKRRPTYVQRQR